MENLMTEAATPIEGQASPTDTTPATVAADVVEQPATEPAQPAVTEPAVPESYEWAPVEGMQLGKEVLDRFGTVAKELKLSQAAAQKVLSEMAPAIQSHQIAQIEKLSNEWAEASKANPEFGGNKLNASLAIANKALNTFGTPELRALLNESGLANHPDVIGFLVRAGKATSEDVFVPGHAYPNGATDLRSHFPASNMNP